MRDQPVPDEHEARERAWRVVAEARTAMPATARRRPWRPALVAAAAGSLIVLALTPPGAAVGDWIRDTIDPGRDDARPALDSLPAPGRLLVTSDAGAWVVQADGSERRLGPYREADFSPRGLYVAVTRGRRLLAVDPKGEVRWSLTRSDPIRRPSWSAEPGFRVAYLSGSGLRVVAGDGTADAALAPRVADVTPAWRPGRAHVLAYVDGAGRIVVQDTDRPGRRWRSAPGPRPLQLEWTPDGRRLLALSPGELGVYTGRARMLRGLLMPVGREAESMALRPGAEEAALIRSDGAGGSEAVSVPLEGAGGPPRRLFRGEGSFSGLAWSPDGRWLLLSWRDADQWLFIRSAAVRRVEAVSRVGRHFDPGGEGPAGFPELAGWCCG
jgi:hypothetical protein